MKTTRIGIIMNGVTGRMGTNQHLMRSIVPIIRPGGVRAGTDTVLMPEPLLVGCSTDKLKHSCGRPASAGGPRTPTRRSPIRR